MKIFLEVLSDMVVRVSETIGQIVVLTATETLKNVMMKLELAMVIMVTASVFQDLQLRNVLLRI